MASEHCVMAHIITGNLVIAISRCAVWLCWLPRIILAWGDGEAHGGEHHIALVSMHWVKSSSAGWARCKSGLYLKGRDREMGEHLTLHQRADCRSGAELEAATQHKRTKSKSAW